MTSRHRAPGKPQVGNWRWLLKTPVSVGVAAGAALMLVLGVVLLGCQPAPSGRSQPAGQEPAPVTTVTPTRQVVRVIDGDTIQLGGTTGPMVRLIGIDTPERGQCGYTQARDYLRELIATSQVTLTPAPGQDRDRHNRLLRYVTVHAVDLGLAQIQAGYAVARYDSRDGYPAHPRQATYIAADAAAPPYLCTPTPTLRTEAR